MNAQQQWEELNDRVESLMAEEGVRNLADAFEEVRRRYPHLRNAKRPEMAGVAMTTPSSASRVAAAPTYGGSAERELDQRAREMAARERIAFAQAYVRVLNSDSGLYLRICASSRPRSRPRRAVADIGIPTVAPGWSKFAGALLADLSSDDLRDLHRQARMVSLRLALERELRRRAKRQPVTRARRPRIFA